MTHWNGNLNLRFRTIDVQPPNGFQSNSVRAGEIINESVPASPNNPIHEPSPLLLLGSGLVGLIGQWMKKAQA